MFICDGDGRLLKHRAVCKRYFTLGTSVELERVKKPRGSPLYELI